MQTFGWAEISRSPDFRYNFFYGKSKLPSGKFGVDPLGPVQIASSGGWLRPGYELLQQLLLFGAEVAELWLRLVIFESVQSPEHSDPARADVVYGTVLTS